jgi:hypothetical protein
MRILAASRPQNRKRTTGTPRPRTIDLSGQVSWLAGRRLGPAFPGSLPVTLMDLGSPLTVAGAAPALAYAAPASLLASGRIAPKNLDVDGMGQRLLGVNPDIRNLYAKVAKRRDYRCGISVGTIVWTIDASSAS